MPVRKAYVVIRDSSGMVRTEDGTDGNCSEIPLNVTVRNILADCLAGLAGELLLLGRKGRMTTRTAEQRVLMKYARLAGVEVAPHQLLRHALRLVSFCSIG